LTKTGPLSLGGEGNDVADLYFLIGYDDPVDQQFHQLPLLLKGGAFQTTLHPSAKTFYGASQIRDLYALLYLSL
jgi:hypothetical protein